MEETEEEDLSDNESNDYNEESNFGEADAVKKYDGRKSFQKRNFRLNNELDNQGEAIQNLVLADKVKEKRESIENQSLFGNNMLQLSNLKDLDKVGTNSIGIGNIEHASFFPTPISTASSSKVTGFGDTRSKKPTRITKLFHKHVNKTGILKESTIPVFSTSTSTRQNGITLKILGDHTTTSPPTSVTFNGSKHIPTNGENGPVDNSREAFRNNSTTLVDFDKNANANSSIREKNENRGAKTKVPIFRNTGANKLSQKLAYGMLGKHKNRKFAQYLSPRNVDKEIFTTAIKTTTQSTTIKAHSPHKSSKKRPFNFKNIPREQQIRHKTIFI